MSVLNGLEPATEPEALTFFDIPRDCCISIFEMLHIQDKLNCMQVCKQWQSILRTERGIFGTISLRFMDRTETLTVSGSTVEFGASDAENLPYAQLADFSAFLISVAPALDMLNISGDLFRVESYQPLAWLSGALPALLAANPYIRLGLELPATPEAAAILTSRWLSRSRRPHHLTTLVYSIDGDTDTDIEAFLSDVADKYHPPPLSNPPDASAAAPAAPPVAPGPGLEALRVVFCCAASAEQEGVAGWQEACARLTRLTRLEVLHEEYDGPLPPPLSASLSSLSALRVLQATLCPGPFFDFALPALTNLEALHCGGVALAPLDLRPLTRLTSVGPVRGPGPVGWGLAIETCHLTVLGDLSSLLLPPSLLSLDLRLSPSALEARNPLPASSPLFTTCTALTRLVLGVGPPRAAGGAAGAAGGAGGAVSDPYGLHEYFEETAVAEGRNLDFEGYLWSLREDSEDEDEHDAAAPSPTLRLPAAVARLDSLRELRLEARSFHARLESVPPSLRRFDLLARSYSLEASFTESFDTAQLTSGKGFLSYVAKARPRAPRESDPGSSDHMQHTTEEDTDADVSHAYDEGGSDAEPSAWAALWRGKRAERAPRRRRGGAGGALLDSDLEPDSDLESASEASDLHLVESEEGEGGDDAEEGEAGQSSEEDESGASESGWAAWSRGGFLPLAASGAGAGDVPGPSHLGVPGQSGAGARGAAGAAASPAVAPAPLDQSLLPRSESTSDDDGRRSRRRGAPPRSSGPFSRGVSGNGQRQRTSQAGQAGLPSGRRDTEPGASEDGSALSGYAGLGWAGSSFWSTAAGASAENAALDRLGQGPEGGVKFGGEGVESDGDGSVGALEVLDSEGDE